MAKIKISELAIELGCDGKALLSFLQEKGIEAKRSNSSIDDNEAEIARNHFGKNNALFWRKTICDKGIIPMADKDILSELSEIADLKDLRVMAIDPI